jgi:hypothetical protein
LTPTVDFRYSSQLEFSGDLAWTGMTIFETKPRKYRRLAEEANDPLIKEELVALADICDKVANNIEDHLTAG